VRRFVPPSQRMGPGGPFFRKRKFIFFARCGHAPNRPDCGRRPSPRRRRLPRHARESLGRAPIARCDPPHTRSVAPLARCDPPHARSISPLARCDPPHTRSIRPLERTVGAGTRAIGRGSCVWPGRWCAVARSRRARETASVVLNGGSVARHTDPDAGEADPNVGEGVSDARDANPDELTAAASTHGSVPYTDGRTGSHRNSTLPKSPCLRALRALRARASPGWSLRAGCTRRTCHTGVLARPHR
jgi:hypothetical protein